MKPNHPLVSVIIPAYNAEAFIRRTLTSVLSQTYTNIEILVVDDGSQDQTAMIVESFIQQDRRVQLLQQTNSGVASARNLAIENSRGEYIAPIDADDIWYPQNIEKQVQCMLETGASVGVVYAFSVIIDEHDLLTGGYQSSKEQGNVYIPLLFGSFIGNGSATLIRRACVEQVGGYSRYLGKGCEDWELYLRIAEHYEFRVVPEFLIGYRQVVGSMSCNLIAMANNHQVVLEEQERRNPKIPAMIYRWARSYFCLWLAGGNRHSGNYWKSIFWTYEAFKLDAALFLDYQIYIFLLSNLLKLIVQSLTSFIQPNHISWLSFKKQQQQINQESNRQHVSLDQQLKTISEMNKQIDQGKKTIKNPYYKIREQRLSQFTNYTL